MSINKLKRINNFIVNWLYGEDLDTLHDHFEGATNQRFQIGQDSSPINEMYFWILTYLIFDDKFKSMWIIHS